MSDRPDTSGQILGCSAVYPDKTGRSLCLLLLTPTSSPDGEGIGKTVLDEKWHSKECPTRSVMKDFTKNLQFVYTIVT